MASRSPGKLLCFQEGAGDVRRVVLLGRLSGGRRPAAQFFLDTLKRCCAALPPTTFQVCGRPPAGEESEWNRWTEEACRAATPSRVELRAFEKDLPSFLRGAAGVVAAGRSAMESMALGIPVIAMGERSLIGLVTPETLEGDSSPTSAITPGPNHSIRKSWNGLCVTCWKAGVRNFPPGYSGNEKPF